MTTETDTDIDGGSWVERRKWLLSLGLTDKNIKCFRLDQYSKMSSDAWEVMVREALRNEQGTGARRHYRGQQSSELLERYPGTSTGRSTDK